MAKERLQLFVNSIIGGLFISFGAGVFLKTGASVVGAILFTVGLLAICLCKFKLFTGAIGYVNTKKDIVDVLIILLGNAIGVWGVLAIGGIQATVQPIVEAKLSTDLFTVFFRAIYCGILIYVCVDIFKQDQLKGMLFMPFGIATFILIGAEHSIADMCYFIACRSFELSMLPFLLVVIVGNGIGSLIIDRVKRLK